MAQVAIPQFRYHEWPDGKPPALQFKAQTLSAAGLPRQLSPHYDLPSPALPSLAAHVLKHHSGTAPLPFVWDAVNKDYFCYEPETTCYVYAKLGRIHYDPVKREHYRPEGQQRLVFASTYPEYRIYQTGEIMFWDTRRQNWYQYDMQSRRILWRDQRWWPFPPKFEPPSLNSPPRSPTRSTYSRVPQPPKSPTYHILPVAKDGHKHRVKPEEPRIINITPFDTSTIFDSSPSPTRHVHEVEVVHEDEPPAHHHHHHHRHHLIPKLHKHKSEPHHSHSHDTEIIILPDTDHEILDEVPSPRRGRTKHRRHHHRGVGGTVYDLQDLVDKSLRRKRRYSWF